jgi:hypothetical protein
MRSRRPCSTAAPASPVSRTRPSRGPTPKPSSSASGSRLHPAAAVSSPVRVEVAIELSGGETRAAIVDLPRGAPGKPLDAAALAEKGADCVGTDGIAELLALDWAQPPRLA